MFIDIAKKKPTTALAAGTLSIKRNLTGFRIGRFALDRNHHIAVLGFQFGVHAIDKGLDRIDLVLDVVAELERRDHTFFDKDRFTGTRIAGRSRLARLAAESAETTNFNGVAFNQFFAHKVQKLFDDGLDIVAHKSSGLGDFLNQCLFSYICHAVNIGLSKS